MAVAKSEHYRHWISGLFASICDVISKTTVLLSTANTLIVKCSN